MKSMQMRPASWKDTSQCMKLRASNNHRRIVCKQEMLSTSNLGERQLRTKRGDKLNIRVIAVFPPDEQQNIRRYVYLKRKKKKNFFPSMHLNVSIWADRHAAPLQMEKKVKRPRSGFLILPATSTIMYGLSIIHKHVCALHVLKAGAVHSHVSI